MAGAAAAGRAEVSGGFSTTLLSSFDFSSFFGSSFFSSSFLGSFLSFDSSFFAASLTLFKRSSRFLVLVCNSSTESFFSEGYFASVSDFLSFLFVSSFLSSVLSVFFLEAVFFDFLDFLDLLVLIPRLPSISSRDYSCSGLSFFKSSTSSVETLALFHVFLPVKLGLIDTELPF